MSTTDTLRTLLDSVEREHSLVSDLNKSALSRLVWFVAISGFGLTGSFQFLEKASIAAKSPLVVYISLPWLLASIFAILAHILIDEMVNESNEVYHAKAGLLGLEINDSLQGKDHPAVVTQIIDNTHTAYVEHLAKSNMWRDLARRFERLSAIGLLAGFVITPIVLFCSL